MFGPVKISSQYLALNASASLLWDTGDLNKITRQYSVLGEALENSDPISKNLYEMEFASEDALITRWKCCGIS